MTARDNLWMFRELVFSENTILSRTFHPRPNENAKKTKAAHAVVCDNRGDGNPVKQGVLTMITLPGRTLIVEVFDLDELPWDNDGSLCYAIENRINEMIFEGLYDELEEIVELGMRHQNL